MSGKFSHGQAVRRDIDAYRAAGPTGRGRLGHTYPLTPDGHVHCPWCGGGFIPKEGVSHRCPDGRGAIGVGPVLGGLGRWPHIDVYDASETETIERPGHDPTCGDHLCEGECTDPALAFNVGD